MEGGIEAQTHHLCPSSHDEGPLVPGNFLAISTNDSITTSSDLDTQKRGFNTESGRSRREGDALFELTSLEVVFGSIGRASEGM